MYINIFQVESYLEVFVSPKTKVIQDILFPKSFESTMCIDCGSITMPDESRVDINTYVPIRAGMTQCESISFHFSTENWKPSRDFCQECNEYEEKEVLKNPGVDWTNPEQNLILVKPTFEDGAIGASKTKFSIGSNALIGNKKFQCILMGIKDTFYL